MLRDELYHPVRLEDRAVWQAEVLPSDGPQLLVGRCGSPKDVLDPLGCLDFVGWTEVCGRLLATGSRADLPVVPLDSPLVMSGTGSTQAPLTAGRRASRPAGSHQGAYSEQMCWQLEVVVSLWVCVRSPLC